MIKINLKELAVAVAKVAAPVAKVAIPAIAVAVITHRSVKGALVEVVKDAARDELAKRL